MKLIANSPIVAAPTSAAHARCPVELTLDVISGKWKPLILFYLFSGALRFGELERRIPKATRRMLTLHLRELERDGLIIRHVFAEVPPRVEYALTDRGRTLGPVLDAMLAWGLTHGSQTPAQPLHE